MRSTLYLTVVAMCLCAPLLAHAADPENPRTINTTGESTVYVKPDEVVINLGIETWDKQLDKSKSANDAAAKTLLAAIHEMGVEEKHVQADVMQVQIEYPSSGPKNGIEGYYCRRGYAITLKDVSK